jgi:hypothetical protein
MTTLPTDRSGVTRRLHLEGSEGSLTCYATLNRDASGQPIELILRASKKGTLERGLLHCLGLVVTIALQHGVPAGTLTAALRGTNFEPAGGTGCKDIPWVKSISDYVAMWMEVQNARTSTLTTSE